MSGNCTATSLLAAYIAPGVVGACPERLRPEFPVTRSNAPCVCACAYTLYTHAHTPIVLFRVPWDSSQSRTGTAKSRMNPNGMSGTVRGTDTCAQVVWALGSHISYALVPDGTVPKGRGTE